MSAASLPSSPVVHAFEHGRDIARPGQRRALGWALGVNVALLVVEVVGGIAFGSLALLADAAHLVSDVAGLGIALGALILMVRPVTAWHSFGFARAEVMAAQVSALLLLGAGVWVLIEGLNRLSRPVPVQGMGLIVVGALGLAVNGGSAIVVHRAEGESLNMRTSFVHLATDAAGSLGAILAGVVITAWGWTRADSVASIATALLVLWTGWRLLRESTHVLMEGTPRGLAADRIVDVISQVPGVAGVHHLHVWSLASDVPALSVHVAVLGDPSLREAQAVGAAVRAALVTALDMTNVTLELENDVPAPARPGRSIPS
jgi:cobalt-zinc-cadmium efflux system protein